MAMVKAEQEAAEKELAKEEEERKRKKEELKRRKRMLEAAFDGDVDEMKNILQEVCRCIDKISASTFKKTNCRSELNGGKRIFLPGFQMPTVLLCSLTVFAGV